MRLMIALIVSLLMLSSCATMESAWDSTVNATSDTYDWVVGNDEEETK